MAVQALEEAVANRHKDRDDDHSLVHYIRRFDAELADLFERLIGRIEQLERCPAAASKALAAELQKQRLMFREEILDLLEAEQRAVA
ncbi:hypothetical protein HDIA_1347 [Hartmannibacter diazotrophicus]|uniref:Uncharacterized protein n=1 Tax=Hartmannibacter diazotrophicus TaxID=1482074 RepID=A0A2C9D400_9HYPH|nr:hypothetical protein [Hartmannibacter diazotrophicus]SON54888.1 hypothetical protein HDIA_1347 [Hartmannibacter diazotrophicus]